jgi:hypothetical protein
MTTRLRADFNSTILEFMDQDSIVQALAALAHPVRLDRLAIQHEIQAIGSR